MRETFAIKTEKEHYLPGYLPGFGSRAEAEAYLRDNQRERGVTYSVVYVKEYYNRVMDRNGNFTISSIAEIPEPPQPEHP